MQSLFDVELPQSLLLAIMSINAPYAERILTGEKQIELRRTSVRFSPGTHVFVYQTHPTQAVLGTFVVEGVISDKPTVLWEKYANICGIDEESYRTYFHNARWAYGVVVRDPKMWKLPLSLRGLRAIWPTFVPPQRYCLLRPEHPAYKPLSAYLVDGENTRSNAMSQYPHLTSASIQDRSYSVQFHPGCSSKPHSITERQTTSRA